METTVLDQEKFKGAKELADIGVAIAKGRAVLAQLADQQGAFLDERDAEMRERIELILAESEDLIRQIGTNHDELTKYRQSLDAYVVELTGFFENVLAFNAASNEYFETKRKECDAMLAAIRKERAEIRTQKLHIDAMRDQDKVTRAKMKEEQRLIKDNQGRLERAWAELEANKKKA